jgi:hypothetical protein
MLAVQLSALLPILTRTGPKFQIWRRGGAYRTESRKETTARSSRDVLKIWKDELAQHPPHLNRVIQNSQPRVQASRRELNLSPSCQKPRHGSTRKAGVICHLRCLRTWRNRCSAAKHQDNSPLHHLHLSRTPRMCRRNRSSIGPRPSQFIMLDCQRIMPIMPHFKNSTIPAS